MKRYTMFLDWKNKYYENVHTIQSDMHIQCNPYQFTNGILTELEQKSLQFVWKHKDPEQPKKLSERKTELEEPVYPTSD